jgi:TorA maturation chaperone TorD
MRILVAGQGKRPAAEFVVQKMFFDAHIAPWVFLCCDAILDCSLAHYYRDVAQFAKVFLALERDSFAMD